MTDDTSWRAEPIAWEPDMFLVGKFDAEQRAVYDALWEGGHVGAANAITRADLVERSGISDRQVRKAIASLIEHHVIPICSSATTPTGYYLARTQGEVYDAAHYVRQYGISCMARQAALKRLLSDSERARLQRELPIRHSQLM